MNKFERQTTVDLCRDVAETWYENYRPYIKSKQTMTFDYNAIWEKLKALQGQGTKEQIDEIIGNTGWTTMGCSLCRTQGLERWLIGLLHDYSTVICFPCVNQMKELIDEPSKVTNSPGQ